MIIEKWKKEALKFKGNGGHVLLARQSTIDKRSVIEIAPYTALEIDGLMKRIEQGSKGETREVNGIECEVMAFYAETPEDATPVADYIWYVGFSTSMKKLMEDFLATNMV